MDPNSESDRTDAPKDPGRRWLLKSGAVAGPLVLTLRGGGGWVGSGTRCNWKNGQRIPDEQIKKMSPICAASLGLIPPKK